jgi:hypothetical protein
MPIIPFMPVGSVLKKYCETDDFVECMFLGKANQDWGPPTVFETSPGNAVVHAYYWIQALQTPL